MASDSSGAAATPEAKTEDVKEANAADDTGDLIQVSAERSPSFSPACRFRSLYHYYRSPYNFAQPRSIWMGYLKSTGLVVPLNFLQMTSSLTRKSTKQKRGRLFWVLGPLQMAVGNRIKLLLQLPQHRLRRRHKGALSRATAVHPLSRKTAASHMLPTSTQGLAVLLQCSWVHIWPAFADCRPAGRPLVNFAV